MEKLSKTTALCTLCQKTYSHCGNTSNLRKHLEEVHKIHVSSGQKYSVASESDADISSSSTGVKKQEPVKSIKQFLVNSGKKYAKDSQRNKSFTKLLQCFLVENYLPFQMVESDSFKNLIAFLDARFEMPSRKSITTGIDILYENVKKACIEEITHINEMSVTMDIWTDTLNTKAYLGIVFFLTTVRLVFVVS